jgi:hypothetical protein
MKTYYLHVSYTANLNGKTLAGDCLYRYNRNETLSGIREELKKSVKELQDMEGLPSIMSIDILPKRLFEKLWGK